MERFLTRPAAARPQARQLAAPPGAPMGQPTPSWLDPALMSGDLPPLDSMLDSVFPTNPIDEEGWLHTGDRELAEGARDR